LDLAWFCIYTITVRCYKKSKEVEKLPAFEKENLSVYLKVMLSRDNKLDR